MTSASNDWTTDTADAIERAVSLVRDRTVEPVQAATKAVVYGLLAALIGLPAVFLLLIGLFRVLVIIYQGETWAAWLTMGGIFVAVGGFFWAKRTA
jgi:hypothetical protein